MSKRGTKAQKQITTQQLAPLEQVQTVAPVTQLAPITQPAPVVQSTPVVAPVVVAPLVAPVVAPVASVDEKQKKKEKKEKKPKDESEVRQMHKKLGIHTTPSRVRTLLDKMDFNLEIDNQMQPIKQEMKPFTTYQKMLDSRNEKTGKITPGVKKVVKEVTVTNKDGKAEVKSEVVKVASTDEDKKAAAEYIKKNAAKYEECKDKRAALTEHRVRFRTEAALVISIISDAIVSELSGVLAESVSGEQHKQLTVAKLFRAEVDKLPLYALYKDLPVFVKHRKAVEASTSEAAIKKATDEAIKAFKTDSKEMKEFKQLKVDFKNLQKKLQKKEAKEAKEAKKNEAQTQAQSSQQLPQVQLGTVQTAPTVLAPISTKTEEQKAQPVKSGDSDKSEKGSKTIDESSMFRTSGSEILRKVIASDPRFEETRISKETKQFFNDLIVEFIRYVTSIVRVIIDVAEVKTVTGDLIIAALKIMLKNNLKLTEKLEYKYQNVPKADALAAEKKRVEESKAKRRVEKLNGVPKEKLSPVYTYSRDSLPQDRKLVVVSTTLYQNDAFSKLNTDIDMKLVKYRKLKEEAEEERAKATESK